MSTTPTGSPQRTRSNEFPHCSVCEAPVSIRASHCAVCDAPAPPRRSDIPSGEIASGEWVRFQRPPEQLKELYTELVRALAPNIRVLGMVGEGGMAYVFVGRDAVLKREVAVKMLSPVLADDDVARTRFTREAEAIAAVSHPNIVNVYQVGEVSGNIPYFVMQFVDGPTLGMGSLRGRMLTEARVRRLMVDVAAGLAAAHRRKVYHRDIKPNNIVLDGETGRALVLDFGISAAYSSRRQNTGVRLTEEGMYLGTPTYMSPEQGNGEEVTGKSDVYSLGVLAYELLVGRPPFEGSPIAVMASHMRDTPPRVDALRSDVSEEFATLIHRCLEKAPARRPTAQEIVHFLMPGEKQIVEWPPPGMARVRSAGARLVSASTATAVSGAVFFAAVAMIPTLAVLRGDAASQPMVRSLVLGSMLAFVFGSFAMTIFSIALTVQRWRWAATAGYPGWVVADVLCDTHRDAGSIINGNGDFVFVAGPTRRRLLLVRRVRVLVALLAAVVAVVGAINWIAEWFVGSGATVVERVPMTYAAPLLALFALYLLLGLPEWRVRRRERKKAAGGPGGENVPPLQSELVTMWMASAERARKGLGGGKKEG